MERTTKSSSSAARRAALAWRLGLVVVLGAAVAALAAACSEEPPVSTGKAGSTGTEPPDSRELVVQNPIVAELISTYGIIEYDANLVIDIESRLSTTLSRHTQEEAQILRQALISGAATPVIRVAGADNARQRLASYARSISSHLLNLNLSTLPPEVAQALLSAMEERIPDIVKFELEYPDEGHTEHYFAELQANTSSGLDALLPIATGEVLPRGVAEYRAAKIEAGLNLSEVGTEELRKVRDFIDMRLDEEDVVEVIIAEIAVYLAALKLGSVAAEAPSERREGGTSTCAEPSPSSIGISVPDAPTSPPIHEGGEPYPPGTFPPLEEHLEAWRSALIPKPNVSSYGRLGGGGINSRRAPRYVRNQFRFSFDRLPTDLCADIEARLREADVPYERIEVFGLAYYEHIAQAYSDFRVFDPEVEARYEDKYYNRFRNFFSCEIADEEYCEVQVKLHGVDLATHYRDRYLGDEKNFYDIYERDHRGVHGSWWPKGASTISIDSLSPKPFSPGHQYEFGYDLVSGVYTTFGDDITPAPVNKLHTPNPCEQTGECDVIGG